MGILPSQDLTLLLLNILYFLGQKNKFSFTSEFQKLDFRQGSFYIVQLTVH